jgi:hypothetical protein
MPGLSIELPRELLEALNKLRVLDLAWWDGFRTGLIVALAAAVCYLLWRDGRKHEPE